jgi:glycosyltransferase involved in cell wall biosynthesis
LVKVIHLIHGFNTGGAETLVKNYALLLDKHKFDLTILCHEHRDSPYEKILRDANIKVIYLCDFFHNKISKRLGMKLLARRIIRKIEPDIIHTHLITNAYVKFTRPRQSTRIFYTQHYDVSRMQRIAGKEIKLLKWITQNYKSQFIAINHQMCNELNRLFQVNNTAVINNGINLEEYRRKIDRDRVRQSLHIPIDSFIVAHVGRFEDVKNHLLLVDVFHEISKRNPKAYLMMIGSGPTESNICNKLNSLGLGGRYTILHNRMDVPALLKSADAAVFPSVSEGLGIAVIEMQAAGLPVIVSKGVPDQVRISNYIDSLDLDKDPGIWAETLLQLYDKRKNDKRAELDKWDIKESVKQLEDYYLRSLMK